MRNVIKLFCCNSLNGAELAVKAIKFRNLVLYCMTPHRCFNVLLAVLALTVGVLCTASAQEVFGGLRGTITRSDGAPAAGAQVALLGTAFGAVADEQGRYAIAHSPAGDYTVRAELPALEPGESGVRVRADGTTRLDLTLGRSGVAVEALEARHMTSDAITFATHLPGALLDALPVDDARQALTLMPGVVSRGTDLGIGMHKARWLCAGTSAGYREISSPYSVTHC